MLPEFLKNNNFVLDHIAVATKDLTKSTSFYSLLGLNFNDEIETVEEQKVKVKFANIDQNAKLELLEPTSEDSPIAIFIDKKGEGIHHFCFRVNDLNKMVKELEQKEVKFIYKENKIGAHNMLINFIHPKSTGGVLIELAEKQK